MQEELRRRAQERGEDVWIPSALPSETSEETIQRARTELEQARERMEALGRKKACELWGEDLAAVMPVLLEWWATPVWKKKSE